MADGGCYQAEGPLLALSWLTRVTGIWLGGCLAVCTLGSPPPRLPHGDLTQLHSPWSKAPCRHFLTIYVLVPQAGGMPCTKILSLAHIAHASWPPRRLLIVLRHCPRSRVITCGYRATVKLIYYKLPIYYNTANCECVFPSSQAAIGVHSFFLLPD